MKSNVLFVLVLLVVTGGLQTKVVAMVRRQHPHRYIRGLARGTGVSGHLGEAGGHRLKPLTRYQFCLTILNFKNKAIRGAASYRAIQTIHGN